jgi:hypothetical protein
MMDEITREECLQFVIHSLYSGDSFLLQLFELRASQDTWITRETYLDIAEIIYKNIPPDAKDSII